MADSSKKYLVSREVLKYPYCGSRSESKEFLSEKICSCILRVRQKITNFAFLVIFYVDFIFRSTSIMNSIIPSQAISLPIVTTHPPIIRSNNWQNHLSQKVVMAPVREIGPQKIVFSEEQMDKLYQIAIQSKANSINREEVIAELRGGDIQNIIEALGVVMAIIAVLSNVEEAEAFQVPPAPGIIPLPHLAWLYGNSKSEHPFGFNKGIGPPSISIVSTEATRNAGSEREDPSNGSWDYVEIMLELDRQSHQKKIEISVGNERYILKNIPRYNAEELGMRLADQMYDSIRNRDTDVSNIARNLNFKPENVQKIKKYVFINKHYLYDDYGPDQIEYKLFDANLQQALAWKRLETGNYTKDDITWLKHECVEQFVKSRSNLTHSEAHKIAQQRFNGAPWDNNY